MRVHWKILTLFSRIGLIVVIRCTGFTQCTDQQLLTCNCYLLSSFLSILPCMYFHSHSIHLDSSFCLLVLFYINDLPQYFVPIGPTFSKSIPKFAISGIISWVIQALHDNLMLELSQKSSQYSPPPIISEAQWPLTLTSVKASHSSLYCLKLVSFSCFVFFFFPYIQQFLMPSCFL